MLTATTCNDRLRLTLLSVLLCLLCAPAAADTAPPQYSYLLHCAGCHLEDGSGMEGVVPDLTEHLGWFASTEEGRSYLIRVPGSSQSPLSDAELATLLNWMVARYAPDASTEPFTGEEVTAQRRTRRMDDASAVRIRLLEQKPATTDAAERSLSRAELEGFGRLLFDDQTMSRHRNLACSSCHDPDRAYSDSRAGSVLAGVSSGTDGTSFGVRNAPSLTYISETPVFQTDAEPRPDALVPEADAIRGGFFWDGRMPTLEEQVIRPFLNGQEMGLRDEAELAARVRDNPRYQAFLDGTPDTAVVQQVADALSAFLRSDELSPYDSRYDRFVRGEVELTRQEEVGMGLFFSAPFTSCADCHQSKGRPYAPGELFTNHRYSNIGTPVNTELLNRSGIPASHRDGGLSGNPAARTAMKQAGVDPAALQGRFKVSSLRNVAVTAPYMHNGVFEELSTVLTFYNHFNESGRSGQVNPETGEPWAAAAYPERTDTGRLQSGFPLAPRQLDALMAFLRTLTDQRYEHLLD